MAEARVVIPGGVNSPVRAFGGVGGDPPFIAGAAGAGSSTWTGTSTWTTWVHGGP